jgi:uncharacterized protein YecT (DUF1311 family)
MVTVPQSSNAEAASRPMRAKYPTRIMFIGLAFGLAVGSVAAADRETSNEYTSCLDKAGGVTVEMMDCIGAETKRQDARLNDNYKRLLSKLSANRKKALTEAQRAWISFRDANCRFYYDPDGGSLARVSASECTLNATADRAAELKQLTDGQ